MSDVLYLRTQLKLRKLRTQLEGTNAIYLYIIAEVVVAAAEGRPHDLTSLGITLGLSPTSVIRHTQRLIQREVIEGRTEGRSKRLYAGRRYETECVPAINKAIEEMLNFASDLEITRLVQDDLPYLE